MDPYDDWDDEWLDNCHRRQPRVDPKWVDPRRTRSKHSHPYNYDAYYHWREKNLKGAHAEYHDRMQQWDWEKYQEAFALVEDKGVTEYTRDELSAFLSAYFGRKVKAVALVEGCNHGNGYPYWIFYYREVA